MPQNQRGAPRGNTRRSPLRMLSCTLQIAGTTINLMCRTLFRTDPMMQYIFTHLKSSAKIFDWKINGSLFGSADNYSFHTSASQTEKRHLTRRNQMKRNITKRILEETMRLRLLAFFDTKTTFVYFIAKIINHRGQSLTSFFLLKTNTVLASTENRCICNSVVKCFEFSLTQSTEKYAKILKFATRMLNLCAI